MTALPSASFPSGCRAFLRDLSAHVIEAQAGDPIPHVEDCRSCADRLAAAVRQDRLLRQVGAPVPPQELRSPQFLAAIHERVVAACEASALGQELEQILVPVSAPAAMPWPEQALPEPGGVAVASGPDAPAQLWSRVRGNVLAEIHDRQIRRRRRYFLASAAAGILLSGAAVQLFSPKNGTSEPPEPVLVRVDSPPPGADFISPGLALQQAVPR